MHDKEMKGNNEADELFHGPELRETIQVKRNLDKDD